MPKIVTPRARAAEAAWIEYRNEVLMRAPWENGKRAMRRLRRREFIAGYLAAKREDDEA